MADNINKNAKSEETQTPKQEVKEVLVQTYKDNSTKPTRPEERAKIESEVTMVKVGVDFSGNWIYRRSDRMTTEDTNKRQKLVECIRNGMSKRDIHMEFQKNSFN
jgi:hypothetical protein